MSEKYLVSQHFRDPQLGEIAIRVHANATSFKARWQGGILKVTIPPRVTAEMFNKALNSMRESILSHKPNARYFDGQSIDFEDFSIKIAYSNLIDHYTVYSNVVGTDTYAITIGAALDFSNPEVELLIIKHIKNIARFHAKNTLPIIAQDEFQRLGIANTPEIEISHGLQRLGFCTPSGRIAISYAVAFLPNELRRFVICHEAAHLREHNHSKAFHNIVNEYVGGREAELEAKLKSFVWPIPR